MLRIVSACVAVAVGGIVVIAADGLRAQSDPAAIVEERQELMKRMGRSFGPLVEVIRGESDDLEAAAEAAATMNDAAMTLAGLFPEGTAAGDVEESRAKPDVWTRRDEFEANLDAMIEESGELAEVAAAGDEQAFQAQFQEVARACGACHESRGSDGGEFRFPSEE